MSKKSFSGSPALAFITPQSNTHEPAHEAVQQPRNGYIRTQGRKGHKKPRINLAFDSHAFLDRVRACADREGKSITQLVNDAVAYYIEAASPAKGAE